MDVECEKVFMSLILAVYFTEQFEVGMESPDESSQVTELIFKYRSRLCAMLLLAAFVIPASRCKLYAANFLE